jgi:hypothetical protein
MEPSNNHLSKTSVSIMMVVLALLAVVIPFSAKEKKGVSKRPPLVLKTDAELKLLLSDRDGNESEDWKDLILETMSTSTRAQIASQRVDPLAAARLADKTNLSASFSKNIYTAAAYTSKNPNLTEDEKTALIADAVKSEAPKIEIKTYVSSELTIATSDSMETKKAYGNAMATLLNKANASKLGSNDLLMLQSYTEKADPALLTPIFAKKGQVDNVIRELLAISVPPSASIFHLQLVNAASSFSSTLDAFARSDSDPLRSLAFLNSYPDTIASLFTAMSDAQDYFVIQKVSFTAKDPGYIFINRE